VKNKLSIKESKNVKSAEGVKLKKVQSQQNAILVVGQENYQSDLMEK